MRRGAGEQPHDIVADVTGKARCFFDGYTLPSEPPPAASLACREPRKFSAEVFAAQR